MARVHWSDCAVHNGPAYEPGRCDCGGLELAGDGDHSLVPGLIAGAGSGGLLIEDSNSRRLIQSQEFPADRLVADASASNLPDPHDRVSRCACPYCMDFNYTGEPVVADFKASA